MKRRQHGVTLMELLVVCAVIGILASIAIPAYRRYVIRANRSSAKTLLLQTAQALERCYTNSSPYAYNSATCNASVTLPSVTPDGTYRISGVVTANAYTLTARPLGAQTQDTLCNRFILDQAGTQNITGTSTVQECWRR